MLLMITERCEMGCSHCFLDCKPTGEDMTQQTFDNFMKFWSRVKIPTPIMVTGGEPTLHPLCFDFIDALQKANYTVCLLTNGMWLDDDKICKKVVQSKVLVQITNDERFYPKRINEAKASQFGYTIEKQIRIMSLFGRAKKNKIEFSSYKKFPDCFNTRSICRLAQTFDDYLMVMMGKGKFCNPDIVPSGNIKLGEHNLCQFVGNVNVDSKEQVLENIKKLKCDNCGLSKNLDSQLLRVFKG
jgi:organic radical activating enzyme